jgi:hypothetical protein
MTVFVLPPPQDIVLMRGNNFVSCEILFSHEGTYMDVVFLIYGAMWFDLVYLFFSLFVPPTLLFLWITHSLSASHRSFNPVTTLNSKSGSYRTFSKSRVGPASSAEVKKE